MSAGIDLTAVLAARKSTHGEFRDHARVVQRLKTVVADEMLRCRKVSPDAADTFGPLIGEYTGDPALDMVIAEAMDMILHKIGRIIAGNATFRDHWDDIAGYARLVAERVP